MTMWTPRAAGITLVQLLVVVAIIGVAAAMLFPSVERARAAAQLALCKDHLRQVGIDLRQYARLSGGVLPISDTIDGSQLELTRDLTSCRCIGDMQNYFCPANSEPARTFSQQHFNAGSIGYYYYSATRASGHDDLSKFLRTGVTWPRKISLSMNPKTWLMSDIWISAQPTAHPGFRKGVNYLMLDGSVAFVAESPRQAFH